MAKVDDLHLAKCPFFISSGQKSVCCEGITSVSNICIKFISNEERNLHRHIFCDAKYQNCEIFMVLEKKYED